MQNNLNLGRKRISILKEKEISENLSNPGNMLKSIIKKPGIKLVF